MESKELPVKEDTKGDYDYDLLVIGGGSGGLAMVKEAVDLAAKANKPYKAALADFVEPTAKGTKWGLGGTCVNVGCIPKKLMHFAAITGDNFADAKEAGWNAPEKAEHNWKKMKDNVSKHIRKLNWGYKKQLIEKNIQYFNNMASFVDPHTILLAGNPDKKVTVNKIVVAIGTRPSYGDVKGAEEFGITSDDLFWLDKSPGKTLVVGASYVALECAGFLTKLGCDVTLMVRSIFLRGYDQDMAERVGSYMEAHGTKIYRPAIPLELSKSSSGKIKVLYKQTADNVENTEEFDTVLFAIGRKARTETLNIEKIGVSLAKNKKIITNQYEQTEVPNIYAIGDVAFGKPELTPVAIMAGRLLASRLMRTGTKLMDYTIIPSCVYTPLEYGFCGLTEEGAKEKYGKEQIIVYHSGFKPLEWNFLQSRESDACYIKLIVENATDRILGYHYLGPNAGEVVQGYASALMMGVTKEQWDSTVKIHPTCSEEMLALHTVKGTGANAVKTGC